MRATGDPETALRGGCGRSDTDRSAEKRDMEIVNGGHTGRNASRMAQSPRQLPMDETDSLGTEMVEERAKRRGLKGKESKAEEEAPKEERSINRAPDGRR